MDFKIPKCTYQYNKGKLWIKGIGDLYSTRKEAEKIREKRYEKIHVFSFFGKLFYANVAKYDFWPLVEAANGKD